jgi:hypothetical protein
MIKYWGDCGEDKKESGEVRVMHQKLENPGSIIYTYLYLLQIATYTLSILYN